MTAQDAPEYTSGAVVLQAIGAFAESLSKGKKLVGAK